MSFIKCRPFIVIVFLHITFSHLEVDGKKGDEIQFNHTEFEVLANSTTESLDAVLQQVLNCSSVFSISEALRYVKICAAEELGFHESVKSRKRRSEIYLSETSASHQLEYGEEDDSDLIENIQDSNNENQRTIRGIIISNDKLREHLPWKWLELQSIRETPCIAACILEELQVLNETMEVPDRQMIIKRITDTVTNVTVATAESITDRCIFHYDRMMEKIPASDKGDPETYKCKATVKLAICISKMSYEICKADPNYKPITAITTERPKGDGDD